jgi:universal stress protein E
MFAVASPAAIDPVMVEKAARVATALGAELELFHCAFDEDMAHPGGFSTRAAQEHIRELVESRRRQLERTAQRLRAYGVYTRSSVRWDHPINEGIVRQALRHEPILLIAESLRRPRGLGCLFGRTDFRLIERCPCPVLFLRSRRIYPKAPVVLASVDPETGHRKPADLDDQILQTARALCDGLSGKLVIFHARTPWEEALRADSTLRTAPEVVADDVYSAYCSTIDERVMKLAREYGVSRAHVHILEGDTAEALPIIAHGESADIVAMGAVSRPMWLKLCIGHTAERAFDSLRKSDVLVVKPQGFRTAVTARSRHHVDRSAAYPSRVVI